MIEREYHFIGGPRDGQRILLKDLGEFYDVLLQPPMQVAFHPDAPVNQLSTFDKFTYKRLPIQRQMWVFVPASWFDQHQDIQEYVIDYLVRGYMGNNQS